jgi:molybdopterin-containing oxidoreductase family membrane subunit
MATSTPGVLGAFDHVDGACAAIRELKATGHKDLTVYTAAANHEIEAAIGDPVSPVRLFTLIGRLIGCGAGFGVAIWMSRDWPLLTGAKPIGAIPPFVVIGFELTILIGSLVTVAGIIILSMMKSLKGRPYSPRFSDDQIGIFVPCRPDQAAGVAELLTGHGSVEVSRDA